MCGITGYISSKLDKTVLEQMTEALKHRGPDAYGYYFDATSGVGLGHRRLSILDLSANANQPFWSKDKRYVMIYNGEVYNYREIGEKYQIVTTTTSDTEVILEGFALKGNEIFSELNGMFTIAIWDVQQSKLTLARDRIGIKPLYVSQTADGLLFGSEIKALLKARQFDVNKQSVAHFLHLGYLPAEESLYKGITKFPAGHYGTFAAGKNLELHPYWVPEEKLKTDPQSFTSLNEAKKHLDDLLTSSISYRMISDVPLGTFLSGGTDSSTVTAIAQKISGQPVKTFSIGFKESKFNESEYAAKVAKHLHTDHHEYILSQDQALELFDQVLDIYDEPFADSSSIPTLLVSEIARNHVTVALSGDGGDELFMGYGMYNWAERLSKPGVRLGRKLFAAGLSLGDNRMKRAANLFRWDDSSKLKSHIFSQEQYYFTERELTDLLSSDIPSSITIDESDPGGRQMSPRERQAFFDVKNYLKDDLLVKVDRASMFHSLEVRVPLLDHRMVEFGLNLPEKWKRKNGHDKFLLKEVLYDYVPREYFQRPKWGFGIPLHHWLKGDLKYLIDKHLDDRSIAECNLVRPSIVAQLKKRFFAGEDYLYNRIWVLLILHKWYKKVTS